MYNRRAHTRIKQHQTINVRILSNHDEKKTCGKGFSCSSEDLSVGGIQFSSLRQIDVNADLTLQVSFTRPTRSFTRKGRVVWIRKEEKSYRMGVFFTNSDPRSLLEWRSALAALGQA